MRTARQPSGARSIENTTLWEKKDQEISLLIALNGDKPIHYGEEMVRRCEATKAWGQDLRLSHPGRLLYIHSPPAEGETGNATTSQLTVNKTSASPSSLEFTI